MKLKVRIRAFWRRNKWCPGMYVVMMQIVAMCFCQSLHGCIGCLLNAVIFGIVWHHERRIIAMRRVYDISRHRTIIMLCKTYELNQEKEAELKKDIETIALKYDAVKKENERLKIQQQMMVVMNPH